MQEENLSSLVSGIFFVATLLLAGLAVSFGFQNRWWMVGVCVMGGTLTILNAIAVRK